MSAVIFPARLLPEKNHLNHLDALRGIAAIGVVSCHSVAALTPEHNWVHFVFSFGLHGVQLFYIVSAFTLCYSASLRKENERYPLSNYFIRRFFRIAPLFYLAVAANLLLQSVAPAVNPPAGLSIGQILLGLFFLNGLDPASINTVAIGGWSIAVETSFYLFLPLILSFVKNLKASLLLLAAMVLLMPVLSYLCNYWTNGVYRIYFYQVWFPSQLPFFCMGITLYYFWRDYITGHLSGNKAVVSLLLFVAALAVILPSFKLSDLLRPYGISAGLGLFTMALCFHNWRLLVNPIVTYFGKISYSIYLGHFFALMLVTSTLKSQGQNGVIPLPPNLLGFTVIFAATLILAIPLAILTYSTVEKPGIRFGQLWIQRREGQAVPARL
jgi:peptidoglycan/LPS O-acetylase OafA/YrhL